MRDEVHRGKSVQLWPYPPQVYCLLVLYDLINDLETIIICSGGIGRRLERKKRYEPDLGENAFHNKCKSYSTYKIKYGSVCLAARAGDCKSLTMETPVVRVHPGPPNYLVQW